MTGAIRKKAPLSAANARGLFDETVASHAVPSHGARERFLKADATEELHRELMLALPCMTQLEVGKGGSRALLTFPLTLAAWNLERCYFPAESAALLAESGAGVVLLSEVDAGMARTGQRHTSRDIAGALAMNHAFAVEFLELGLGSPKELQFCKDDHNVNGFHGNALLSRTPLTRSFLVRLDDHGHWFDGSKGEKRVGGRCAIGAVIDTAEGPLLAVSVHLESNAGPDHRAAQMSHLLDCFEELAGDMPVIIGGDLNTGVGNEADYDAEPLFAQCLERGFERFSGSGPEQTVRNSRISTPRLPYKIDWFLARGVDVAESRILPALAADGTPLSDHEMVTLTVVGFSR